MSSHKLKMKRKNNGVINRSDVIIFAFLSPCTVYLLLPFLSRTADFEQAPAQTLDQYAVLNVIF